MGAYSIYIGDHALDYQKEMLNPRHRPGDIPPEETLLSAKCEMSLNSGGSCQFVVPPTHPYYLEIKPMITEVIVVEIDNVLWFGRVTDISTDWLNHMTVNCEGPYAYLNDSVQPYQEYFNLTAREYLAMILSNHNSQVPEGRQIMIADVQESAIRLTGSLNYESSMELVQNFLADYGGYIYLLMNALTGKAELYWISGRDLPSAQPVAYGVNLLDFNRVTNYEDICTSILPLSDDVEVQILYRDEETGQVVTDEEGKSITFRDSMPLALDMNRVQGLEPDENGIVPIVYTIPSERVLSNILIDGPFVQQYGRIIRRVLFPGITSIDTLRSAAYQWIWNQILGGISVTVDAVDLRFLDPENGRFYLGLSVECTSEAHNISEMLVITNIEIDILKVDKRITLGHLKEKTLSDIAGRGKKAEVTEILDMRQGFHPIRKIDKLGDLPVDANTSDKLYVVTQGYNVLNTVRQTNFFLWAVANGANSVFWSPEAYANFLSTDPYVKTVNEAFTWYPTIADFGISMYSSEKQWYIYCNNDNFDLLDESELVPPRYDTVERSYSVRPNSYQTTLFRYGVPNNDWNVLIAPVSGIYTCLPTTSCVVKALRNPSHAGYGTSEAWSITKQYHEFSGHYSTGQKIFFGYGTNYIQYATDYSGKVFLPTFDVVPDPEIFMAEQRAGHIRGIFGSLANGHLDNVFTGFIVSESMRTIYNLVTNQTISCSSWTYDFTSRTYAMPSSDGDNTYYVTFGDNEVTITDDNEDVYTIYYGAQDEIYYRGDRVETAIYRGNTVWDSLPHG